MGQDSSGLRGEVRRSGRNTSGRALGRRDVLRWTAGVGLLTASGTIGQVTYARPAAADDGDGPDVGFIIDTEEWGARPPTGEPAIWQDTTERIVVHHTAGPNTTDYSRERAIALARGIQNHHMDGNGWWDTGQHFTVSRGGYVLEGRHRSLEALVDGRMHVQSAHAVGENIRGIGIENEGHYHLGEVPTQMLWDALVRLCAVICRQYGFGAHRLFGHWDFNNTQCPGIYFYRRFAHLRLEVARAIGQRASQVPARTWPDVYSSSAGAVPRVVQHLLNHHGFDAGAADGAFGPLTVAAVQAFQDANGLAVSDVGMVSDVTWERLVVPVDRHSSGLPVTALQSILVPRGYQVTVDGAYGSPTRRALQEMQLLHGLPPRGILDVPTWCASVGGVVAEEFTTLRP